MRIRYLRVDCSSLFLLKENKLDVPYQALLRFIWLTVHYTDLNDIASFCFYLKSIELETNLNPLMKGNHYHLAQRWRFFFLILYYGHTKSLFRNVKLDVKTWSNE